MKIPLHKKLQIFLVVAYIKWLNCWLFLVQKLFFNKNLNPKNILIYKVGNIGDIVCAIPSFIAIRKNFPKARITLLTSPGNRNAFGAKELLMGVWYLDEICVYYGDEIDSSDKKKKFISNLRKSNYDLFIQLPDDLANFRTLFRNMVFAKLIGAGAAFGFKIRTAQFFKKTQVDYSYKKTEVENLLGILSENGISCNNVEFDFFIDENIKKSVDDLLRESFTPDYNNNLIIAISPAGKREANRWPIDRYQKLASYLKDRYNAKIAIIGGRSELESAKIIQNGFIEKDVAILAGKMNLLETVEFLKRCDFLISNDTGTAHMAAAVNLSVVGIYGIRNVFGSWFPYGKNHKIIHHKFLNCDYRTEDCIMKSVQSVQFEEVANTCDEIIKEIK